MGGICGFAGYEANAGEYLSAMLDKLSHRGPAGSGAYTGEGISFGLRALFSSGGKNARPLFIYSENKNLILAADGAIYNSKELKASLTDKGHVFSGEDGAEVILHLYEEHGAGALNQLRGVFAFVIYDTENKTLFCARDPFGVKPFYYTFLDGDAGRFMFGSEIKCFYAHPGFEPRLNEQALSAYLSFQYSVLPETFFKGVFTLPPAHYLILCLNDEPRPAPQITRYFTPVFSPAEMTLEQAVDCADSAVRDSVAKHIAGRESIGAFLSGGVDSGYVAACYADSTPAAGRKAFTVAFKTAKNNKFDESAYASALCGQLGIEHHVKYITPREFFEHLPSVQYYMDEPLADPATVALYFLCGEAAGHVKTALSGEGADEFFGGYNIYREPLDLQRYMKLPLRFRRFLAWLAKKLPFNIKGKNFLIRGAKTVEQRFIGNAFIFTKKEADALLKNPAAAPAPPEITSPYYKQAAYNDDITKMQYLDIHLWMVGDIMLNADKMSMAHSLELRVPLTDREVFRAASRMPTQYRVNRKGTKYAFRLAAARHLPEADAARKKLGFPVPIRVWLREKRYAGLVRLMFKSETADIFFNTDMLKKLLNAHVSGKRDNSRKIWTVYMFLLWYEQYFIKPRGADCEAS